MTEDQAPSRQAPSRQVPSRQVPEAGDIPAEDATSPQVEYAREHDQAEGDDDQEDDV
jgi:hypothetical protein